MGSSTDGQPQEKKFKFDLARWFNNPEHSDMLVEFSGQRYHAHKLVLTSHSPYFKKACGGEFRLRPNHFISLVSVRVVIAHSAAFIVSEATTFSEAHERKITLHDDDPDVVLAMIRHMYQLPHDRVGEAEEAIQDLAYHVHLYIVAEKYDVPDLRMTVNETFAALIEGKWDSDEFAEAIQLVYANRWADTALQDTVVACCKQHIQKLMKRDIFVQLLGQTALLARELLKDLVPLSNLRFVAKGLNKYGLKVWRSPCCDTFTSLGYASPYNGCCSKCGNYITYTRWTQKSVKEE